MAIILSETAVILKTDVIILPAVGFAKRQHLLFQFARIRIFYKNQWVVALYSGRLRVVLVQAATGENRSLPVQRQ